MQIIQWLEQLWSCEKGIGMTVRAAYDYAVKRRLHLMWLCILLINRLSVIVAREESAGTNKDIQYAHLTISTHLATSKGYPSLRLPDHRTYDWFPSCLENRLCICKERGVYAYTWHRLFFVLQVCAVRRYRQGGSELLSICL